MAETPVQLLVYRFGADAGFEGQLVGALERLESGGALRVLDVLFVGTDPETSELFAIDLHRSGAGGRVSRLLGFRLDLAERRRATKSALADGAGALIRELGETLGPGEALAAVLVAHEWAKAIADAVDRIGGGAVEDTFVARGSLAELGDELRAAAAR